MEGVPEEFQPLIGMCLAKEPEDRPTAPMAAWPKNANGHATVNAVNPFAFADLGNTPTFSDSRVEIEPV